MQLQENQLDGVTDRAGQIGLLVVEEHADRGVDGLAPNGADVVAADDAVVVEPVAGPTRTSLVSPRIVLVIGATVTQDSSESFDWRVRMTAGRRLSSWTDAIVRISRAAGG